MLYPILITFIKAFRKPAKNSSYRTVQLADDADSEQISAIADSGNNTQITITVSINTA
jgi:hypothetical protein